MMKVTLVSVFLVGLWGSGNAQFDLGNIIKPGESFNITEDVNGLMPQMNDMINQFHLGDVKLPDVVCKKQRRPILSGVSFNGLNKMTRATYAEATVSGPDSLTVRTTIVFENTELSADKYVESTSGLTWDIGSLTLDIKLEMLPLTKGPTDCYTKYDSITITDMSNVVQTSSTGTITPSTKAVSKTIQYYNKWLSKGSVLKRIGSLIDICARPDNKSNRVKSQSSESESEE